MGDVGIGADVPLFGEVVAELGISAELFKGEVGAVPVGAIVGKRRDGGKAADADAVGGFGFKRVVGAIARADIGADAVLVHAAGDDVDHAAHGVGAVKHGGRTAEHFYALSQEGLGGVGDGMPEEPHVLGMPVDEHHEPPGAAAKPAQGDAPGSPVGHAVSHDAARGNEQPGDLLGEDGEQRRLQALLNGFPSEDGDGEGEVADVGLVACAGDYDLPDVVMA